MCFRRYGKIIICRVTYINTINAQAHINVLSTVTTAHVANVTVDVRAQTNSRLFCLFTFYLRGQVISQKLLKRHRKRHLFCPDSPSRLCKSAPVSALFDNRNTPIYNHKCNR